MREVLRIWRRKFLWMLLILWILSQYFIAEWFSREYMNGFFTLDM